MKHFRCHVLILPFGSFRKESQQIRNKSHSMEALETPTPSVKDEDEDLHHDRPPHRYQRQSSRRRHRSSKTHKASSKPEKRRSFHEGCTTNSQQAQPQVQSRPKVSPNGNAQNGHCPTNGPSQNGNCGIDFTDGSMASFLRKALRIEGPQLQNRTITIKKTVRESLGMRIGGGIGSNEGDTPIYVANIHPHGCIGKSKQLKVSLMSSSFLNEGLNF